MAIFGEIHSPLWQNLKIFVQLFEGLIGIWQTIEPALEKSVWFWANLHCCKWPNIEQTY